MNLRQRLLFEWCLILLIGITTVAIASQWRSTEAFDNLVYDRLSALSRPQPDDNILLINIDEPSLAAIGKWPWDRSVHAQLIDKLAAFKPRSITLDILLSENGSPAGDEALALSMRRADMVYLPLNFSTPGSDGRAFDTEFPLEAFAAAARGVGHVNINFDDDGLVRHVNLCFDGGGSAWPHIAELVYRGEGTASPAFKRLQHCNARLLLPYSPRNSHSEISYAEAITGQIPAELVRARDIIIGATAAGMGDNYAGPFGDGGVVSGTEIMANMIGALRRNDFIQPAGSKPTLLFSLLPMLLLMAGFLRWQPRTALAVSIGCIVTILGVSVVALTANIWLAPGAALLGVALVYPLWGWRRLQAVSNFMQQELRDLETQGEVVPLASPPGKSGDLVGRQSLALGIAIDQLRDLRRFVSDSLEHLPDPMLITDLDGLVTMANHRIEEYLGPIASGTALSRLLDDIVAPAHRRSVEDYLRCLQTELAAEQDFVRFISPDGRHFVMRSAPIYSDAGPMTGHIHYLADISALAQAENDREEALQLLSHDMRSPQSAIIALLPTIKDDNVRSRIEGHARRTIALAQDFVDVARMGESPLDGTDVLLVDLARDIADNLWPLAHERRVTIEVTDESDSAFVCAEPDSLGRALTNLLDNAVKFSPDGGTIHINISKHDDMGDANIELQICDEGPGIDADLLPRLFTRFAAHSAPDARIKSSGLGLTYVKAVVQRHGGTVEAQNRPEGGACFRMRLPEAAEPIPGPDA